MVRGTWKATIPDQEGVLSGTLNFPVDDDPVDILETSETKRAAVLPCCMSPPPPSDP